MSTTKKRHLNLYLISNLILSAVSALSAFEKTGELRYTYYTSNLNDDRVKAITLSIKDSYNSKGDPNTLVPVTILPIDDDEIELEWNPRNLIEVQNTDDSKRLEHSLYANIDKHVLSGLDDEEVGIIIKVPKDRLVKIDIRGGYQVNILKGFTKHIQRIHISHESVELDSITQYSSPKVNADFTSLPTGRSYIGFVKVYKAHLVLKTSGPIGYLTAGSYGLQDVPTSVEIQGDVGGSPDRSWEPTGLLSIDGPNTTVLVDGDIDVAHVLMNSADLFVSGEIHVSERFLSKNKRLGKNTVHAGGIMNNSEIEIRQKYDVPDFTIMVPNCTNIIFEFPYYYSTGNSPAECLEKAGPQVSVDFLSLESLSSSFENYIYPPPPHKTRWEIIAPVIAVCAVILIICGIFTYHRVKGRTGRVPDSSRKENNAERAELGDTEPQ